MERGKHEATLTSKALRSAQQEASASRKEDGEGKSKASHRGIQDRKWQILHRCLPEVSHRCEDLPASYHRRRVAREKC